MDPLSITASVIAVWQLTNEVIQYLNDVKDAPKECQQCVMEASNLLGPLISLRYCAEKAQIGDPWFEQLRKLNVKDGPLDQYKQALEQLCSIVEDREGVREVKRRLLWKFSKKEVASIQARMERLKSLLSIAMEMDAFALSQAIKDAIPPLQARTDAINDKYYGYQERPTPLQVNTLRSAAAQSDYGVAVANRLSIPTAGHHLSETKWYRTMVSGLYGVQDMAGWTRQNAVLSWNTRGW